MQPVSFVSVMILKLKYASWDDVLSYEVTYNSCNCKTYEEQGCEDITDAHKSLLPDLVAPTD